MFFFYYFWYNNRTMVISVSFCSILPIWQVITFIDVSLICLVPASVDLHIQQYIPPSAVTNPRTLSLVSHNPSSLGFVLTVFAIMKHVQTVTSPSFLTTYESVHCFSFCLNQGWCGKFIGVCRLKMSLKKRRLRKIPRRVKILRQQKMRRRNQKR